jgi:hypothetical protein
VFARQRGPLSRPSFRTAAKVVVPLAVVAVAASLVLRPPSNAPTATPAPTQVAQSSQSPQTPKPSPTEPGATPEPWAQLVLDPAVVVASVAPERVSANGVATASRFKLRSLDGSSAIALAVGVRADPPIAFRVVAGATQDEAFLEPKEPLLGSTTYRLTLEEPDGALAGSWAFRTERPIRIVGTLPGNESSGVPVTTGIEVTFDQDGTTGVQQRFHIEPKVAGRFEQHGRTWVFVPGARLELGTAYTVTIDAGVGVDGSDLVLEQALSFRFETQSAVTKPEWTFAFESPLAAIRPGEQATFPLFGGVEDEELPTEIAPPDKVAAEVYRLPDLATTLAAAAAVTGPDSWLRASHVGLVDTSRLKRVAAIDAPLVRDAEQAMFLQLPVQLDPGAYIVVIPRQGRPQQQLLQVGNMAVYAVTSDTESIAWVNDLASVGPIAGARVALPDGTQLGTTDPNGLARFTTPSVLVPPMSDEWQASPRIISITAPDGRWAVAGLGSPVSWKDGRYDSQPSQASAPRNRWWLLFNTDRGQFRQTDTIHAWGLVRARDGGAVPETVELRLRPVENESAGSAIERVVAHPDGLGVFAVDVPIHDLPRAAYALDLMVDGVMAESRWIDVTEIRKPSYAITVEPAKHAYLAGASIDVLIKVSFFDGSTVPSMDLRVSSNWDSGSSTTTVTTDAAGSARVSLKAVFSGSPDGWHGQSISVTPVRPEEGEISGGADVIVFPSTAWLTNKATLDGTTLTVTGTLSKLDFGAMNAAYAQDDWSWPASDSLTGAPIAGREVSVKVIEQVPVRRQSGSYYDYVEKRVVTTYDYDIDAKTVGTFKASTKTDGSFRVQATVPSAVHGYELVLTSTDPSDRPLRSSDWAYARTNPLDVHRAPYLIPDGCGPSTITVGLDADATVTMHRGDGTVAPDGRYLFLVANRGLRDAAVGTGPAFTRALHQDDLPGFTIRGVQLTSKGYAIADASIRVDTADLALDVQLKPDRARYAPGDRVTVQITTLGPDGRPIDADVVVQGVDEKLFAIGAASEADALAELHGWTDTGLLQSFTSHRLPVRLDDGGCGAEGGSRESFGDVVTAQLVRTGADGKATVAFDLTDDLTSWHLTALALSGGLRAGSSSILIPVGLPFFVETVLAPEYLVGEAPVLRVRGYGDALRTGDVVTFTISAPTLGIDGATVTGKAFDAVRFALPTLVAGSHRITVEGKGPGTGLRDAITRTIHVAPSRLAALVTQYDVLAPGYAPTGGDGLTTYAVLDAGRGALVGRFLDLASSRSARFDASAAAEMARRLLIEEFDFTESELEPTGFDASRYEQYGIALLPYASRDPELTALAAVIVPSLINVDSAREYLRGYLESDQPTVEARAMVVAGLAGLGDDVLDELRTLAAAPPSIRASLWIALGLAVMGDENGARTIERDLLSAHGQRFGPWVRLVVGTGLDDTNDATRLLLILSSRLGEPFAPDVARYLQDHPTQERSLALEELAFLHGSLDRLPRAAGRFAWTVDGERHEVELERGEAFNLVLTAPQRRTLVLEPLAGKLSVVTSWTGLGADVPTGGPVTITRVVTPANDAPDDQLVRVSIHVSFTGQATRGCWQLTDLAPSGLVPIERRYDWPDADIPSYAAAPWSIDGQRVSWCAMPDGQTRDFEYVARVVSPGSYRWEPAVIQSLAAPEIGMATDAFTFRIR